jgi:hypothetical protein
VVALLFVQFGGVRHPATSKKEKLMPKTLTLAVVLGLLATSSAQAEDFISPSQAREVAQELVQRNLTYYSSHPDRVINAPEWRRAEPTDPILVHTYPDLRPCYYLVPVANRAGQIVFLI